MRTYLRYLSLLIAPLSVTSNAEQPPENMAAYIQTNRGEIVVALNSKKAPISVANFIRYAEEGFYTDTIFHRVIDGFMIQGGGMTADLTKDGMTANLIKKETHDPIHNESDNGLQNLRGTISYARTQHPNSATSQFFINLVNNFNLNHRPNNFGYTVFGKVIEGMDVVDDIAKVETEKIGMHADVPVEPIVIESVRITQAPGPGIKERVKKSLQTKVREWFSF